MKTFTLIMIEAIFAIFQKVDHREGNYIPETKQDWPKRIDQNYF